MNFVNAYEYDPSTYAYKQIIKVPEVNNSYPLPLNSTWTKPMEEKKAFILKNRQWADDQHEKLVISDVNPDETLYTETVLKPILHGDGWELKVYEIGKKWYNTNSQRTIINFVGNPTDYGLVFDKPKISRSYSNLNSYSFWKMMRMQGYPLTYFLNEPNIKNSIYYDEIKEAIITNESYEIDNIIFNKIMDLMNVTDVQRRALWVTFSQNYHQLNRPIFSPKNKIWDELDIGKEGLSKTFKKIEILNPNNNQYERIDIPQDVDIKAFAREWIFDHGEYELDLTTAEITKYVDSARLVTE